NPDGSLAAVVMNGSDKPVDYRFFVGRDDAKVSIPAHAIQTLVVR
ncbi:MAG TPA: glycoside hydrolase family 30 beta sandwich domain-containing protein, partial [Burkholderiaceae bacterium]|nr:glycoside hydrolase family 30 beta sandwich domain-containing protein [Burkholderiaceae bacterium]